VSDVLVYDRLLIPVPPDDDRNRWDTQGWNPALQDEILRILRDGDEQRVVTVSWNDYRRAQYADRIKMELAAGASFDTKTIAGARIVDPDAPIQQITRMVLADYESPEKDAALARTVAPGIPPTQVSVVAAYRTARDLQEDTGIEQTDKPSADPGELLGGFVWPFVVPAGENQSDQDLLMRAVDFANNPEVAQYRQAFHRWRAKIVNEQKTPQEAASALENEIGAYGDWVRRQGKNTVAQAACLVVGITAGVAAAIVPIIGLPIVAGVVGATGAAVPAAGAITSRIFRGNLKGFDPQSSPGALFWEAQRAFR
jgi:hypothetical protein